MIIHHIESLLQLDHRIISCGAVYILKFYLVDAVLKCNVTIEAVYHRLDAMVSKSTSFIFNWKMEE